MNFLRSMDFPRARELRLPKVVVRRKEEPHHPVLFINQDCNLDSLADKIKISIVPILALASK